MKIFTSLVLLLVLYLAHSQVIGIDFGTEFWKASLISPGKNLVIVENSRSERKSYNGVTNF
jgi:hypoxia up-regulated 1